jgi:putative MATE family efflux protein
MNANNKIKLMSEGKIPNVLLKLGMPLIAGLLVNTLYSAVDAYFVKGLGTSAMAAVFVVFPIGIVLVGFGLTFGGGAGFYISRLLGSGDKKQADRAASTALFSGIFIVIILAIAALGFLDKILVFMGATDTILPYAKEYAVMFIFSSILSVVNVTMNNLTISQGDSNITLISMLTGAVLNIILDPIFIYVFGWGIKGAATATLTAQAVTTLFYVWYILGGKSHLRISLGSFAFDKEIYAHIIKLGTPVLIQQVLTTASMGLINTAAGNFGDSAAAAMGIVTRIIGIGSYIVLGYVKGFQPFAGYNYGAKNYGRLKEVINVCIKWSTGFCIIWAVLMIVLSRPIVSIFSNDAVVIDIAERALKANSIMFITFGFQLVYSVLCLTLGKAREGGILTMGRQGIFFIPVILILPRIIGLNGVIYTQAIADLLTTIMTVVFAVKIKKELNALDLCKQEGA